MNIHSSLLRTHPDEPKLGWMLLISFILHLGILAAFAGNQFGPREQVYYSPAYTVSLVSGPGPPGPAAAAPGERGTGGADQSVSLRKGPSQLASQYKTLGTRKHTITVSGKDRVQESLRQSSTASGAGERAGASSGGAAAGRQAGSGTRASGGGGSPGGQASPSAASLRFSYYYESVWNKIQSAWILPRHAEARRNLEAIVMITIARDGKIVKTQFEKRSGDPTLDNSALRAIQKADPLPPLPAGLGGNTLELGIRFVPGDMR
jgi:colicin import membrane protein